MSIRFKLFVMMALEFFIWGAWLPLIFGYLPLRTDFSSARKISSAVTQSCAVTTDGLSPRATQFTK